MLTKTDPTLLQMALIGYEAELQRIQAKMEEIRSALKGAVKITRAPRRKLSAAARKRIATAQKKRWAAFHSEKSKPAPKKVAAKRKLSPGAKAKLVANLAKARAAKAAKAAAA